MDLLIFCLICYLSWRLLNKAQVPAAAIIGPLAAIVACNLLWRDLTVPGLLRPVLSVVAGMLLGFRFNIKVRGLMKPLSFGLLWMIITGNIAAVALYLTGMDSMTALFASMPGGGPELAIASMSSGADSFEVMLFHTARMLFIILIIPFLLKRNGENQIPAEKCETASSDENRPSGLDWFCLAGFAFLAGFGLNHLPAGNILGSLLAVGIYVRVRKLDIRVKQKYQDYAVMGIGGLIGLSVTEESLLALPQLVLPLAVLCVFLTASGLLLGYLLHKYAHWGLTTSLLATAPGGILPICMLAIELGADAACVATFHAVRLIGVLLIAPLQAQLLEHVFH